MPVADLYWNARGGSYTDGGAFLFTVPARRPTAMAIRLPAMAIIGSASPTSLASRAERPVSSTADLCAAAFLGLKDKELSHLHHPR